MATRTDSTQPQVSVQLTACRPEDARAVFAELGRLFRPDVESAPHEVSGLDDRQHRVWSAEYTVAEDWPLPRPPELRGPVDAELQGSPHAVQLLESALTELFTVRTETDVAGDQEEQTRVRLEAR
ncbi:hypothetical protein [Streptomyces sulphureus]|uniref:hypothetical protein n=1 Tax=Streptomyces sulphureus TaxID=47758 RepID=UPI000366C137|nr:hypothetical protein [Streptomyces sulphureus]